MQRYIIVLVQVSQSMNFLIYELQSHRNTLPYYELI